MEKQNEEKVYCINCKFLEDIPIGSYRPQKFPFDLFCFCPQVKKIEIEDSWLEKTKKTFYPVACENNKNNDCQYFQQKKQKKKKWYQKNLLSDDTGILGAIIIILIFSVSVFLFVKYCLLLQM